MLMVVIVPSSARVKRDTLSSCVLSSGTVTPSLLGPLMNVTHWDATMVGWLSARSRLRSQSSTATTGKKLASTSRAIGPSPRTSRSSRRCGIISESWEYSISESPYNLAAVPPSMLAIAWGFASRRGIKKFTVASKDSSAYGRGNPRRQLCRDLSPRQYVGERITASGFAEARQTRQLGALPIRHSSLAVPRRDHLLAKVVATTRRPAPAQFKSTAGCP